MDKQEILRKLAEPFHPSAITFKPGAVAKTGDRALALAYADLREYQNRLDAIFGTDWDVDYRPWGDARIIATVTVRGRGSEGEWWEVNRSSTGETKAEAEKGEIAGTVAEAQAFKRACAMLGLGRYLYEFPQTWQPYDKTRRQFTEAAKATLLGVVTQHYRKAMSSDPAPVETLTIPDMGEVPEMSDGYDGGQGTTGPDDSGGDLASASDIPGLANLQRAARQIQAKGGPPMSDAQAKQLARVLEWAESNVSVVPIVTGVPLPQTTREMASALLQRLSKKHSPNRDGKYEPNPEYSEEYATIFKTLHLRE